MNRKDADTARRLGSPTERTNVDRWWRDAAPRASQAATGPRSTGGDAGAAHDPHKPAAGHTEARMRPEDVPEEWTEAARAAWSALDGADDWNVSDLQCLRGALAAVIPAIRENAIRDLEAGRITEGDLAAAGCETRHIIDLRDDGWTIRHPLSCRPTLFDCPVNRAAERDLTEPPAARGAYACTIENGRFVVGEAA